MARIVPAHSEFAAIDPQVAVHGPSSTSRLMQARPHGNQILVLHVEVASGIRGLSLGGKLADADLDVSADLFRKLPVDLHPSLPLIPRILSLRKNFSAYDANYVALTEAFECPLLTYDRRLAEATQKHCDVEVVAL